MKTILIPSDTTKIISIVEFEDSSKLWAYFGDENVAPCVETVVGLGPDLHASAVLDETPTEKGHNDEVNERGTTYMGKSVGGSYLGDMILVGGSMLTSDGPQDVPFDVKTVTDRIDANAKDIGVNDQALADQEAVENDAEMEAEVESLIGGGSESDDDDSDEL